MSTIQKLILGTVQFGLNYGINNVGGKPDKKTIDDILITAYEAGIHTLDTAEAYGNAHEIIGKFHSEHPNVKFKIITKLPHIVGSVIEKVNKYLGELQVSNLEVLMLHSFNTYTENTFEVGEIVKLKQDGKIKHFGVSIYTNEELLAVIEDDRIDVIQLPFNLFDNLNKRGNLLKLAKEKSKIIHSRSAFLQGLFFKDVNSRDGVTEYFKSELTLINKIAEDVNITVANLALNYVLYQNNIDQVLIGVDRKAHLVQNIESNNKVLKDYIIEQINGIDVKNENLLNPSKWNCLKQS